MNLITLNTHETTMTAPGRAKDGEGRASQVEPIFGDLIDSFKSAQTLTGKARKPDTATIQPLSYENTLFRLDGRRPHDDPNG